VTELGIFGFLGHIEVAAKLFLSYRHRPVVLLHHNDADGLTSGAILAKAFERLSVKHFRYCLEKPYPEMVRWLLTEAGFSSDVVFFLVDFGSGMLPLLSQLGRGRTRFFVLDHHLIEPVQDETITVVNCLPFGISGTTESSAATVAYLFAHALSPLNVDLARVALVGVTGDGQSSTNGLNSLVLRDAGKEWSFPLKKLAEWLDALGSFEYFSGGPDVALKGLFEEFDERYQSRAEAAQEKFEAERDRFFIENRITDDGKVLSFHLGNSFTEYGVKTVGLLCQYLAGLRENESRYVLGFQRVPNKVPGVGPINLNQIKVSMRLTPPLLTAVREGHALPLTHVLPTATKMVGGFVDACHPHAAATTVPLGEEEQLLGALRQLL
jgi:single-stranded-DNA-specific exonuclease